MKPNLSMIELFSGIGAQKRGIDNTNLYNLTVIATSDVDKEALVEYAAIHHGLTNDMVENYIDYPSREEMVEELKSRNIGMDFDKDKMYDWSKLIKKKTKELEKYWLAMHLQNNLGDISKIESLPEADCWFYSSPCQCFSIAGRQDGIEATCNVCGEKYNPMNYDVEHRYICPHCGSDDVKGTRSGLLLEVERLLIRAIKTNTQPKYLCLENVKNLVGKQFKPDFNAWLIRLDHLGYNTYWKVLNAKSCGVPQNRERVFAFSIRKDIDNGIYNFPLPFDTGIRLKDILETNVDERYYINTDRASNVIKQLVDKGQLNGQRECCDSSINDPRVRDISNCITARYDAGISNQKQIGLAVAEPKTILVKNQAKDYTKNIDVANTLIAKDYKGFGNQDTVAAVESYEVKANRIGGLWDEDTSKHQAGSIWDSNGVSPTLDTAQGGGRQPHIVEKNVKNQKTSKSIWKDINSNYKISNKGVVVDVINKSRVEEIDGKVALRVKNKIANFPIELLLNKYFSMEELQNNNNLICVGNTTTNKVNVIGNYMPSNHDASRVIDTDGVAPTVKENHGTVTAILSETNYNNIIGIKQATKKGYIECKLPGIADFSFPNSTKRRERVQDEGQTCPTLTAAEGGIRYIESIYRIRKLTVRECFKLMGFEFEDWDKCEAMGVSNSAGYKAAGNSIVTNCISLLFEHLFKAQYDSNYICTDEKFINFMNPKVE